MWPCARNSAQSGEAPHTHIVGLFGISVRNIVNSAEKSREIRSFVLTFVTVPSFISLLFYTPLSLSPFVCVCVSWEEKLSDRESQSARINTREHVRV